MSIRKIRLAINSKFKLEVESVQVIKYLTCFIISLSVFNNSCINRQKKMLQICQNQTLCLFLQMTRHGMYWAETAGIRL